MGLREAGGAGGAASPGQSLSANALQGMLDKLSRFDTLNVFERAPTAEQWPTYAADVPSPMDLRREPFHAVATSVEDSYTLELFAADFRLMCENAIIYEFPHAAGLVSNLRAYADALLDHGNKLIAERMSAKFGKKGGRGGGEEGGGGGPGRKRGGAQSVTEDAKRRRREREEKAASQRSAAARISPCERCATLRAEGCGTASAHSRCLRVSQGAMGTGDGDRDGPLGRQLPHATKQRPASDVGRYHHMHHGSGDEEEDERPERRPVGRQHRGGGASGAGHQLPVPDDAMQLAIAANLRRVCGMPQLPGGPGGDSWLGALGPWIGRPEPAPPPPELNLSAFNDLLSSLESGSFTSFAAVRSAALQSLQLITAHIRWQQLEQGALVRLKDAVTSFHAAAKAAVESVISEARTRVLLPLTIQANTEAYVQGDWRREPYRPKPYALLTDYVLAEPELEGAPELLAKLRTDLRGGCEGDACTLPGGTRALGSYNTEQMRFATQCACLASNIECDDHCGCYRPPKPPKPPAEDDIEEDGDDEEDDEDVTLLCANRAAAESHFLQLGEDLAEQDVWGIDCYTRRNIQDAIADAGLLPAAALTVAGMLAGDGGRSFVDEFLELVLMRAVNDQGPNGWDLQRALRQLIASPPAGSARELTAAAAQAVSARMEQTGPNYFRVHPKGRGLVARKVLPRLSCVSRYLGELYAPWRWLEVQDAIKKVSGNSKALPDFYNILLERPRTDPAGYDLLFVDAAARCSFASRMSHSCNPNCHAMVMASGGRLTIAVYTLRDLAAGEELTFDYGALTEDHDEVRGAVCLCGTSKCRGTFLYYTASASYNLIMAAQHTFADRTALLLKAGLPAAGPLQESEEASCLVRNGLRSAAMAGTPYWLQRWAAGITAYVEKEQAALPEALLRHAKEWTLAGARCEAKGVADNRVQNVVISVDKVRHVLAAPGQLQDPPLGVMDAPAVAEYLWTGPSSVGRQALLAAGEALCEKCGRAAASNANKEALAAATTGLQVGQKRAVKPGPHPETVGCRMVRSLTALFDATPGAVDGNSCAGTADAQSAGPAKSVVSGPGDPEGGLAALASARAGLAAMEVILRAADDGDLGQLTALADLLRLYISTHVFFRPTKYNLVVSPPVRLRPCDLPDDCALPPLAGSRRGRRVSAQCGECAKRRLTGCGTAKANKRWCKRQPTAVAELATGAEPVAAGDAPPVADAGAPEGLDPVDPPVEVPPAAGLRPEGDEDDWGDGDDAVPEEAGLEDGPEELEVDKDAPVGIDGAADPEDPAALTDKATLSRNGSDGVEADLGVGDRAPPHAKRKGRPSVVRAPTLPVSGMPDGGWGPGVPGSSTPAAAAAVQAAAASGMLQKRYGPLFIWGQLASWFKQPVGDSPGAKMLDGRRELISLPDVDSGVVGGRYGLKERATLLEALERPERKPEAGLSSGDLALFSYRNPQRVYGSPFMDAALLRAGLLLVSEGVIPSPDGPPPVESGFSLGDAAGNARLLAIATELRNACSTQSLYSRPVGRPPALAAGDRGSRPCSKCRQLKTPGTIAACGTHAAVLRCLRRPKELCGAPVPEPVQPVPEMPEQQAVQQAAVEVEATWPPSIANDDDDDDELDV